MGASSHLAQILVPTEHQSWAYFKKAVLEFAHHDLIVQAHKNPGTLVWIPLRAYFQGGCASSVAMSHDHSGVSEVESLPWENLCRHGECSCASLHQSVRMTAEIDFQQAMYGGFTRSSSFWHCELSLEGMTVDIINFVNPLVSMVAVG